ncbi:hypothetical protein [Zoogloea sp.]|uniref:hypothetical protein n=1 Tax=Zoogloea sp. TaxID=49181 RepID=UPI0035B043E7
MEDRRSVIPPGSRPRLLGQPYHGLVRDGVLTLSNGKTIQAPWGWGDCYVLRVPGVAGQGVQMTQVEAAQEAAAGRQWLDYAMLVGRQRNYAGAIIVGANAWLYAAPDGTVWRIECDQLDTTTIHPSDPAPPFAYGYYPEFLDFTFTVRRFGVVSPDESELAPGQTRTILQQSLGAEWRSDWFSTPPYKTADKDRRFPGDGYGVQWMPINIDDINSRGSRALFCVNRSREQGMRSEPNGNGRAYPLAWIEVSVSGQGSLDSIQISMALVRAQLLDAFADTSSEAFQSIGDLSADVSFHEIHERPEYGGGIVATPVETVSNAHIGSRDQCLSGSSSVRTYHAGRCAGGYYDGSDVLCWVMTGEMVSSAALSASSQTDITLFSQAYTLYPEPTWEGGPWDCLRFKYQGVTTATASETHTIDCSVQMGPHPFQLPTLLLESSVTRVWQDEAFGFYGPDIYIPPFAGSYSGHTKLTSVFGIHEINDPNNDFAVQVNAGYFGSYYVNLATPYGINASGCNLRHGLQLRPLDNCYVVRVTNKVYAVLADMEDVGFASGRMVIAVGTPQGWVSINAMDVSSIETAYNPVTGQLVTHPSQGLGWV